jgi:pilus assembly protein FimV
MSMNYATVAEKANRYVQKGQFDKAVDLWNSYLPNAGDNEAANALNNLGDLCVRKKNTVAAIDHYLKASHAFEQAGFPLKAIATLKKTLKLDPDRTEVYLRLGDLNARRDMIGNAVEAYLHVCRLLVAEGEHDQALQMVQKVCILDPVNTRHRLQMAAELFELGFTDQAITETVNAIDLFLEGGNLEEAERYCRHLLDLQPGCEAAKDRLERIAHWGEPGAGGTPASAEDTPIDELFAALDMVGEGDAPAEAPEAPAQTAEAPAPAPATDEFDISLPGAPDQADPDLTADTASDDDGDEFGGLLEANAREEEAPAGEDEAPEFELEGTAHAPEPEAEIEAEPESESMDFSAPEETPEAEAEPQADAEWTLEGPSAMEADDIGAPAPPAVSAEPDPDADFMSISLEDLSSAAAQATEGIDLDVEAGADAPEADDGEAPVLDLDAASEADTGPSADEGELDLASLDLTARFREDDATAAPEAPAEPENPEVMPELEVGGMSAPPEAPEPPVAPATPEPAHAAAPPEHPAAPAAPSTGSGFNAKEALAEAHFYEREGLTEEAVKLYRAILDHAPGHPEATGRLQALGHPVPPATHAAPASHAAPTPQPAAPEAGGSDEFSDFTAEIEDTIEREVADSWRQVGEEAQFEEILDAFRKGIEAEVSEDDAETHYDLGIAYHEMGLTEEAIGEFQRAVKGATRFADATIMLARCFGEVGKQRLAVTRLKEAVARPDCGPDQWISLAYELATLLESTGEMDEARRMYEEVYARDITYRDVAKRVASLG